MFKEFQCPENMDKVLSVHYFSPDQPKISKWLMLRVVMKNNKVLTANGIS